MAPCVYLLHFRAPLGNPANTRALARHYIGWAVDLDARLLMHRAGRGAAITRAAVERGIDWDVFVLGQGDWGLEKKLKALKNAVRLCPLCGQHHPAGRLHVHGPAVDQLALDFDGDPFDVPLPYSSRADWWEMQIRRAWVGPTSWGGLERDTSACDIPL